MPPRRRTRKAAVSDEQKLAPASSPSRRTRPAQKTSRAGSNASLRAAYAGEDIEPSLAEDKETTPAKRRVGRPRKSDTAPPDTIGISRRPRQLRQASSPAPSPTQSTLRRSPRAAKPKPRSTRSAATTTRSSARSRSTAYGRGASATADDAIEVGDDDMADNAISIHNGEEPGDAEDILLRTPTRKRGRKAASLTSEAEPSPKSDVFVDIVAPSSSLGAKSTRGRKRKVYAAESHAEGGKSEPMASTADRSAPAKRTRSAKGEQGDASSSRPNRLAAARRNPAVDIVSPSRFEAARSRIPPAKQTAPAKTAGSSDEAGVWRRKYEELFALRISKPEADYEEFKASAQERFDAADALIKQLRTERSEQKRQAKAWKEKATSGSPETADATSGKGPSVKSENEKDLEKQVALLKQQVESLTEDVLAKEGELGRLEKHRKLTETSTDYNLREKLKIMQEVTGFAIEDVVAEDQGLSYICKQSGPNATAGYVLTVFDDLPDDYQYTPCDQTAKLDALPGYLKEPMSFERTSANMFYWRVCDHLHQSALSSTEQQPAEDISNGA
ncbi:hypothetical protein GQ54DRAFT_318472 [Martensiomyces pterosporus]|nr:hypothetical protein GQ54DRAFT_318472 [Martensiomyces pterosporus]